MGQPTETVAPKDLIRLGVIRTIYAKADDLVEPAEPPPSQQQAAEPTSHADRIPPVNEEVMAFIQRWRQSVIRPAFRET